MIDAHYPPVTTPEDKIVKHAPRRFLRIGLLMRLSFLTISGAFLIGFAWFTFIVTQMTQPESVPASDAIVVLTGGTDRLKPAIELLKSGSGKKLLISGVNPDTTKDDIVKAYAIAPELAACCIDLDQIAANTIGNATQSAKWLRANSFGSVILVTSNYHMPRAEKELHRLVGSVKITPYPLVQSDLRNWKWLEQPDAFRLILTEYLKFTLASARHLFGTAPGKSDLAKI